MRDGIQIVQKAHVSEPQSLGQRPLIDNPGQVGDVCAASDHGTCHSEARLGDRKTRLAQKLGGEHFQAGIVRAGERCLRQWQLSLLLHLWLP